MLLLYFRERPGRVIACECLTKRTAASTDVGPLPQLQRPDEIFFRKAVSYADLPVALLRKTEG
jgi:hypothetical protein